MYFIIETYAVGEGQVSKVRFDAGAMDVAPGRHSAGASSAGPAWCMSRTTILATQLLRCQLHRRQRGRNATRLEKQMVPVA